MNKYEIIGIVGEGAYGIVYKAKCKETGEFGTSLLLCPDQASLPPQSVQNPSPILHFCSNFVANFGLTNLSEGTNFKIFAEHLLCVAMIDRREQESCDGGGLAFY